MTICPICLGFVVEVNARGVCAVCAQIGTRNPQ
jgi:hypothetical protein